MTDPSADIAADAVIVDHTRVQMLDPRILLTDVNIRTDLQITPEFVDSLREGVRQEIKAVRTPDGRVRVRLGHRRTAGAIEAGLPLVPVIVFADEGSDTADAIARLVDQFEENESRTGLRPSEKAAFVAQLAAFRMSIPKIAKRARMGKDEVRAALQVAQSDTARTVADQYEGLDFVQAAVVAEFADDPDTVQELVEAAGTGQFEHIAQQTRDARREAAERAAVAQELRDSGLTVIDPPRSFTGPARKLSSLRDAHGEPLTVATHADCPGHVAWLVADIVIIVRRDGQELPDDADLDEGGEFETEERQVWVPEFGCATPDEYGHELRWAARRNPSPSTPEPNQEEQEARREAERARRRDVIQSNQQWRSAETVRRRWLRELAARKAAPKGVSRFLATAQADHAGILHNITANHLAAQWLGQPDVHHGTNPHLAALIQRAPAARVQLLHLVQVLAAYETATDLNDWRHRSRTTPAYLAYLAEIGYPLSAVEQRAMHLADDKDTATDDPQPSTPDADADADAVDTGDAEPSDNRQSEPYTVPDDGEPTPETDASA